MMRPRFHALAGSVLAALVLTAPARAATPAEFLAAFDREARQADAGFKGFSAERGRQFFTRSHGGDWSCASCHTDDPAAAGKHAKTGKAIQPLAPVANPDRFANASKVDKWSKRNCNDVLNRVCTPQEKGDVLSWLIGVKK
jgi:mono/diheme cytochrome c family protein